MFFVTECGERLRVVMSELAPSSSVVQRLTLIASPVPVLKRGGRDL